VTPVRLGEAHRTLREVVADEIRAMIRNGELQPGERLLEDRLAERLGVSRNPVREALRALESTGLVEVQPRRGAYVASLAPQRAVELLELRSVLEAFAAQLAAKQRTSDQLAEIRRWFDAGREATANNDIVNAARAHRQFHMAIEQAAGNSYLAAAVEPLRAQTELIFSQLVDRRGLIGWQEHVELLEAIEAGDADAAQAATRRHMNSVLNDLREAVTADGDTAISAGDTAATATA
jgi:DNA-binding GntR family transcriptional regulator